jgi:hypothetical protein
MAKKYYSDKKMMSKAGGMINDDMSAPCLLPREVMDKEWPKGASYNMSMVDDLFDGVQKQMSKDSSDFRKEMGPEKY